ERFEGLARLGVGRGDDGRFGAEEEPEEEAEKEHANDGQDNDGGGVLFPIGRRDEVVGRAERGDFLGEGVGGGDSPKSRVQSPKSKEKAAEKAEIRNPKSERRPKSEIRI